MKNEIWKQLYEFEDYEISNLGLIKSKEKEYFNNGSLVKKQSHILKSRRTKKDPHYFVEISYTNLTEKKVRKTIYLQRAVADHFIKKPTDKPSSEYLYASNINKDYTNNKHTNIKWITQSELMASQPKRIADPGKTWRTRKEKQKLNNNEN